MSSETRQRKRSVCYIKPKIVFITFNGHNERIEIPQQCTNEDIQDVLRSICGAGKRDMLRLMRHTGAVLPVTLASLEPNRLEEAYRIELISCCPQLYTTMISDGSRKSLQDLDNRIRNLEVAVDNIIRVRSGSAIDSTQNSVLCRQVSELEDRVSRLQHHVIKTNTIAVSPTRSPVPASQQHQRLLTRPRDSSEPTNTRCGQCPYFSNLCSTSRQSVHLIDQSAMIALQDWSRRVLKTHKQVHSVWTQFQALKSNQLTRAMKLSLQQPSFNMWGLSDAELLGLTAHMFHSLGLVTTFTIPPVALDRWLLAVYQSYNCVPFHNFTHAFSVLQMLYSIIHMTKLQEILPDLDILCLMFSAISHDLDHPGLNNSFQVNAKTCLARRYNDQSPLENHHCAMAFRIVEEESANNILKNLSEKQYKRLREMTIKCILGTDMVRHGEVLTEFKTQIPRLQSLLKQKQQQPRSRKQSYGEDPSQPPQSLQVELDTSQRALIMLVIIKACDISNEARPAHVSDPWLDCLLEEFFQQSDLEKQHGLPWAPFMDRERATKCNSQCGFIKFVILPLFELLAEIFPPLKESLLNTVLSQLDYYTRLQDQPEPSQLVGAVPRRPSFASLTPASTSVAVVAPQRKYSAGTNTGCQSALTGIARKTSTGSLPSRKSSTGSMVLAQS